MLKCRFKNQFDFTIDTNAKIIKWGNVEAELKQFIDGITGKILSIAGVKGYSEWLKAYSYITPNIYKKDITECDDWNKLNQLFKEVIKW